MHCYALLSGELSTSRQLHTSLVAIADSCLPQGNSIISSLKLIFFAHTGAIFFKLIAFKSLKKGLSDYIFIFFLRAILFSYRSEKHKKMKNRKK